MKPYAWFVIGAAAASVGWMFVVAVMCDRVEELLRQIRCIDRSLEAANGMVADTMAQSGRMARLAIRPCTCADVHRERG